MSGSSPESGEFAAKHRIGLGFAVTSVPLAKQAADHYREQARRYGHTPEPDDIIYRVGVHVAPTDDQAMEDLSAAMASTPRGSLTMANRALESAVAQSGYYGRDSASQRNRLMAGGLRDLVAEGRILLGSPDSVLRQIETIRRELGAGVLDLTVTHQMGKKTTRSIELIAEQVLPRIRSW
jgi:alkanesulfonate monooxygenase SsuD/methylene tetrahydromethanopterin reductase-like flavin-dependent oxidoreductase (luciferase family)